jgi:hypothetical protein
MERSESTAANLFWRSRTATRRRWLQFSLRGLLALLTVFAIWLGVIVNRAREQREAVKAIEATGGIVQYDWQVNLERASMIEGFEHYKVFRKYGSPGGPAWLRRRIGNDYFQNVVTVELYWDPSKPWDLNEPTFPEFISHLRNLPALRLLTIRDDTGASGTMRTDLMNALPNCEVFWDDRH